MECILTSPFYFSKGIIICVQRCTNIPEKKTLDICSIPTVYPLNRDKKTLLLVLPKKRGKFHVSNI